MNDKKHLIYASLIILTVTIILLFPILKEPAIYVAGVVGGSDLTGFNYPVKFAYAEALRSGILPFWNENIFAGFPLFAEGQVGALFPLNVLFFRLLPLLWAFNFSYIFIYLLTGITTYLFLRRLSLSFIPSLFGATAFMLSGFYIGHNQHLNLLEVAAFFPFLLLVTDLYIETRKIKYVILLVVGLTSSILLGHPQMLFYHLVFLLLFIGFRLFLIVFHRYRMTVRKVRAYLFDGTDIKRLGKVLGGFIFALILSIGISSAQLLPTLEFRTFSSRSQSYSLSEIGPESVSTFYFPFNRIGVFYNPFVYDNPSLGIAPVNQPGVFFHETMAYVGIPCLLLVFIAWLFLWKKNPWIWFFTITGGFTFLLSLGAETIFVKFLTLPGFNLFRVPARFIFYTDFSLIILASLGLQELIARLSKMPSVLQFKTYRIILISLGLGIGFINLYYPLTVFWQLNPTSPQVDHYFKPETVKLLSEELGNQRYYSTHETYGALSIFQTNPGWQNLTPYLKNYASLAENGAIIYGLKNLQGYAGLQPERLVNLLQESETSGLKFEFCDEAPCLIEGVAFNRLAQISGIKYLLSPFPVVSTNLNLIAETNDLDKPVNTHIYGISNYLPPAFIVPEAIISPTATSTLLTLYDQSFNPLQNVIIEKYIEASAEARLSRFHRSSVTGEVKYLTLR